MVPERARERILDIAATQFPDGSAYHQYQPLTKRGNNDVGSGFNDDPLWLILGVAAYIKETGDAGDPRRAGRRSTTRPGTETTAVRAPRALVRLHARAPRPARPAADRARRLERLPQPQLLLRHARRVVPDDREPRGRRRPSRSSSPACSCSPPNELAGIAERRGDAAEAAALREAAARDGRGASTPTAGTASGSSAPTTSSASPVGSAANDEGQIFIEPQGCCVMAGIGVEDGRARRRSTRSRSGSRHRTASCSSSPPTPRTSVELGEISSYPPGYKENAGIFCHTNPWVIIAEIIVGNARPRLRLLPEDQPVGPRSDLRGPPLRAVRVRADDRRAGRSDPRRGEELVADRHGGLELRRGHAVAPRHPARARRPAHRSAAARRLGRASASRAGSAARLRDRGARAGPASVERLVVDGRDGRRQPCAAPRRSRARSSRSRRSSAAPSRRPREHRASRTCGADYHGRSTRRLANDSPVGRRARDGRSAHRPAWTGRLGPQPARRDTRPRLGDAHGRYELFGGHRLWFAPEDPDLVAVPDGSGLDVTIETDGVSLTGRAEEPTGLVRSIARPACRPAARRSSCPPRAGATSATGRSSSRRGRSPSCPLGGRVLLPQRPAHGAATSCARTARSCCGRTRPGRTPGSGRRTAC